MKPSIHPDYHPITIVMTDGTRYESRSTYGLPGAVLQLDVDPKTHPAWVGGVNLRKTGQMEKFNNKFAFLEKGAAADDVNLMPLLVDCAKAYCTVGEMVDVLKGQWGEFQQPVVF